MINLRKQRKPSENYKKRENKGNSRKLEKIEKPSENIENEPARFRCGDRLRCYEEMCEKTIRQRCARAATRSERLAKFVKLRVRSSVLSDLALNKL